ncbi:MAG: VWA domain-containing protein [Chitinophagaceae bacterium]|nr:VWA domain-containing protein [Chitinophagaceae bacterium]
MNFTHFGFFETILVFLFVFFYILYFNRVFRLRTPLGNGYKNMLKKLPLRIIYFSLFLIALLSPSFGGEKREIKAIGKDIFICIDLSESMNASDIQPTRLEKLKFEIKKIAENFHSDRIGIIMFSSEAFMQCPLTNDLSALSLFIETLNTNLVPNTGTDFGPPLKMANEKLNDEQQASTKDQKSKILILMSDGEDFGEETSEIIEKIQEANIKLFPLGIGTEKGSKIKTENGFKKDKDGQDVITKLNPSSLKKLAEKTGGKYFEINENQNDVPRLINAISSIEGELREVKKVDVTTNKYYYFLSIGIILLIIDLLIHIKIFKI